MDIAVFLAVIAGTIWIFLPAAGPGKGWSVASTLAGVSLAALLAWRKGITWKRAGIRLDNLSAALGLNLCAAIAYSAAVLALYHDSLRPFSVLWPGAAKLGWFLVWALFQQFCLLSFLLNRFREVLRRDPPAVLVTAAVFSLLHLPNPFLTLYTFGGGIILALLFLRRPNLPAAALAHAATSLLVGRLLSPEITGWMRVGPLYLLGR